MSQWNNLNSVVLEGVLNTKPVVKNNFCSFNIVNEIPTYNSEIKEYEYEKHIFEIHLVGYSKDLCFEYLNIGNVVRLKGILKNNKTVFIEADHIEFRDLNHNQKKILK